MIAVELINQFKTVLAIALQKVFERHPLSFERSALFLRAQQKNRHKIRVYILNRKAALLKKEAHGCPRIRNFLHDSVVQAERRLNSGTVSRNHVAPPEY